MQYSLAMGGGIDLGCMEGACIEPLAVQYSLGKECEEEDGINLCCMEGVCIALHFPRVPRGQSARHFGTLGAGVTQPVGT